MNLLKNLDRKFGHWLDNMDATLNEPVVRAMTGEVFTHGTAPHNNIARREKTITQTVAAAAIHTPQEPALTDSQAIRLSLLRPAGES
jgi:hypothetical protein